MTHTYKHRFRNGITATATLSDNPPGFEVEWERKPTAVVLPEYFQWRESIIADFTRRTNKTVLVVTV
jgi:hypothetical protein